MPESTPYPAVNPFFEPFTLPGFLFRMAAGVYFAVIFRYRGYGITAGAHAAYNMIYFAFS